MIKASALLVALAIGLLVAGVVTSSLLMVYVSIGVCAVAALLLAAGVLSHWSEIFGRREARSATPGAWSEPQVNVTAPVLASIQAVAAARGGTRPGREEAGVRPDAARAGGGRPVGERPPSGRPDVARRPEHPAAAVPAPAEAAGRGDEFSAPRRSEDLWERVEEELGSAAKRDTGALSWPGTVFPPVPPDAPVPAESAGAAPGDERPGAPGAGASAWVWSSGAGRQRPETADPAWPPPAAAFAESQAAAEPEEPQPAASEPAPPEQAAPEQAASKPTASVPAEPEPGAVEPAEPESVAPGSSGPGETAGPPVADEPAAEPDAGADVARDVGVAEDAEAAPDDDAAAGGEAAADDDVVPGNDAAAGHEAVPDADDHEAADHDEAEPAVTGPPGEPAAAAGEPGVKEPAVEEPAAGEPVVKQPAPGAPEPAADQSPRDGAAAAPAPRRAEVTVVPGVSRYHRSECILIRFLGAGDLEIMTKQEAVDAKFMACRACQPDLLED